jgi:cyclase
MKKYETGYYGNKPGRWEDTAKSRPDVAASKLKPPTLLYNTDMIFDDRKHRVELLHFGVAHTHGDGFAWLPKEKILFTGDAAVNGAYNYVGDGDVGQWIKTLEAAKKLGAKVVCPGHGPVGGPEILEDQQSFFIAIRDEAGRLLSAKKSGAEAKAAVAAIKENLQKNQRISRYIGGSFADQVEKAYVELGGQPFTSKQAALDEHWRHAEQHGRELAAKGRTLNR